MDFNEYLNQVLEEDQELAQEYHALQPEYAIISMLIEARIERGLTQKKLASKCGIKQSNISRLEKGKVNPTIKFLQKIANALDLDLFVEFRKREYSAESITEGVADSTKIIHFPAMTSIPTNNAYTQQAYTSTCPYRLKAYV